MKKYIIPGLFMSILMFVSICYFLVPDKKISQEENRMLANFPEFSIENFTSGKFFSEINSYMNDQFPFRSIFISLGDKVSSLMNLEPKISGDMQIIMNAGNTGGGTGERINGNDIDFEDKLSPEDYESVDSWNSKIMIDKNGRAMEYYYFKYDDLYEYAVRLNKFAYKVPNVNVYSMLVPTASEFYLSKDLQKDNYSQKYAIDTVYSMTVPGVKKVDALSNLYNATSNPENYIYFRTDHHWTARGAYEGYRAFCEAANIIPVELSSMKTATVNGDFYGSFTRLTKNKTLEENPDTIEYYLQSGVLDVTAYTNADMKTPYDTDLFVNPGDAQNKYMVFLGGDNPLTKITTNSQTERNLLIIKDSYGNALTPFFVPHYTHIYVLDPRVATTDIAEFCDAHQIHDLLIESYTFSLSNNGVCLLYDTLFNE